MPMNKRPSYPPLVRMSPMMSLLAGAPVIGLLVAILVWGTPERPEPIVLPERASVQAETVCDVAAERIVDAQGELYRSRIEADDGNFEWVRERTLREVQAEMASDSEEFCAMVLGLPEDMLRALVAARDRR